MGTMRNTTIYTQLCYLSIYMNEQLSFMWKKTAHQIHGDVVWRCDYSHFTTVNENIELKNKTKWIYFSQ